MGQIAAHGAAWLEISQIARIGLTVLSTIVLAWILPPDQYGVIAMVGPLFVLVMMLPDLGLGAATIQARTLISEQSNALFWIDLAAMVVTYAVALIMSLVLRNYCALFLGTLAGACVQSGLSWYASGFRRGRPHVSGGGDMAKFGGHLTGFTLLNFLVRNLVTFWSRALPGPRRRGCMIVVTG
jgi:PST family polysaccharide transporter